MRDLPLPRNLPKMSRREERALKQRIRQQIKPLPAALRDQARNFYMTVGLGISQWSRMEERVVQIVAVLLRTSEAKAGLVMYSIINL
jgi:PleD family two-component response regulator